MTWVTKHALVSLLLVVSAKSFQPGYVQSLVSIRNTKHHQQRQPLITRISTSPSPLLRLDAAASDKIPENGGTPPQPPQSAEKQQHERHFQLARFVSKRIKPFGLGIVTAICFSTPLTAPAARAATPLPKSATMPDAEKTAMRGIQLEMEKKQQLETEEYNKRARLIETKEGSKAREVFEKSTDKPRNRKTRN